MRCFSFLPMFGLAAVLAAQSDRVAFEVALEPEAVRFTVGGPASPFVGAVILSLSPELRHFLVDLPPLLGDFAVLGVGVAETKYVATLPVAAVPPGLVVYAQGVVLIDVVLASDVRSFVLDGGPPQRR